MSLRSTTALASSVFAATFLAAGASRAQSTTVLPPIQVQASPLDDLSQPLTGTVLTQDDLATKAATTSDTARMLQDIPGAGVYSAGGFSSLPVLRGLADDRLNLRVDGIPVTAACPNHMNPALSYTAPQNIGRIEVLPGITPVSNGGDSIGGTILVDSPDPKFATSGQDFLTTGSLSAFYRSNAHAIALGGDVTGATNNVSANYGGSWTRAGDYHQGGDSDPVRASKYQVEDHALTLAARHDRDLFEVKAGVQFSPYEGFPNQRMDMTENNTKFLNGRYVGQFGWGQLTTTAYWRGVEHEMDFLDGVKSSGTMPMNTESDEFGYGVKAEIPLNQRDTLRVGNEFQRYTLDDWWPPVAGTMMAPNDFWNIRNGERNRVGTYAEWERQWTPQWGSLLGVRNDTVWTDTGDVQGYSPSNMMGSNYLTDSTAFNAQDHAKTDVNFDLTALLRYQPDTVSSFEAGYARKTRSPNLYERYTWSTGTMASSMNTWFGDGNGYIGDIDLKPEVAHTLSVSGDWHDPARKVWGFKVSPYYTYVQDYIDADLVSNYAMLPGFGLYKFANHDAELFGIDISGNHRLMDDPDWGHAMLKASLSWVRGRNLDTNENLYNIMPLTARIGVEHSLGGWFNGADVQLVDSKDFISNTRKENSTPAYALLNLRTGYTWENITLSLAVENVFDKRYYEPLGGTDLSVSDNSDKNVAGMGRNIVAGVSVKF